MAVCLMFVFMALLEFSYVNVQCRVQKRRQETILIETSSDRDGARNGKDRNSLEVMEVSSFFLPFPYLSPMKERLESSAEAVFLYHSKY